MLFVGYPSIKEGVVATEARLRRWLPKFFPVRRPSPFSQDGIAPYKEIVLVAHSLGGLVVRRAVTELLAEWAAQGQPSCSAADARLALFSPATAGFLPAGALGAIAAAPFADKFLLMLLHASPAFNDLQQGSALLDNTRRRTEELASAHPELKALRASTMWANPEYVVQSERYDCDPSPFVADSQSHSSVCKPKHDYHEPFTFVETGRQ